MYTKSAVFLAFLILVSVTAQAVEPNDVDSFGVEKADKSKGNPFPFKLDDTQGSSDGSLVKQFFYAIGLVVLLGAASYYVTKKLAPKLAMTHGRQIKILETISVGSRRNVYLIEVDSSKKILIGSTSNEITFLTEINPSGQEDEK